MSASTLISGSEGSEPYEVGHFKQPKNQQNIEHPFRIFIWSRLVVFSNVCFNLDIRLGGVRALRSRPFQTAKKPTKHRTSFQDIHMESIGSVFQCLLQP